MCKGRLIGLGLIVLAALGCSGPSKPAETLTLATTTSTRDSGLLDGLVPLFKEQAGIEVKVVAVGSGQALELGRRGDADVLLTHAPEAEKQFMDEGHGEERLPVMYNDFVLVGPNSDPAKVKRLASASEAFQRIARSASAFVSRGDDSGTHQKEKQVWHRAGVAPQGAWYIRAGAGMAEALRMASEKHAYILSDRATFLAQRRKLDLILIAEGDPLLRNDYAVIVVSPAKHAHVNHRAAQRFARFLVSQEAQDAIARFGVAEYGEQFFFPKASGGK
jgi:tungstate transport system substrate-binding protein